jgi:Permease for cytosine/purines, uracil, thiamine, allantoin
VQRVVERTDVVVVGGGVIREGTAAFHGRRPRHDGHMVLESHGMAPIPEDQRYGASWRNFTVWFAPNLELSGIFTGTLAFTLGLGFWLGFVAIALGVVLGALVVPEHRRVAVTMCWHTYLQKTMSMWIRAHATVQCFR